MNTRVIWGRLTSRHVWNGLLFGVAVGVGLTILWVIYSHLDKKANDPDLKCEAPPFVQIAVTSPTHNTWETQAVAIDKEGRTWMRQGDTRPACWVQIWSVKK